jgi:hypothetical protein
MSLIQIIVCILILVASEVLGVSMQKARTSNSALIGMLNYTEVLFPGTSPNPAFYQSYYDTVGGQCNVVKAYERLVRESYWGLVSAETQIDIVYNSWGELASYRDSGGSNEPCGLEMFYFIVAIVVALLFCSSRRSLTFDEMVRLQYDPRFKYNYISGKF